MTFLRIALFSLSLIGFFIAGGIFFKCDDRKHRSISIFVLLFSLEYLNFLYSTSTIAQQIPFFLGYYFTPIGFLYGPIFLVHITSVIFDRRINFWYHLIPFLIVIFTLSDFFTIADGFERARHLRENFLDRFLYYNYLRSGHIIAYGLYVVYLIRMHWSEVRTSERLYVVSISTIYFISAAVVSLLTEFANSYRDFIWYYLLSSGVSLVIGILLYRDPDFLQNIKKYLRSSLSPSEMKRISNAIKREFESKKLFLKRDMCVNELADLIGEASHKISQTLSVQIGQNFNDYINKFRIEHAKSLLVDPKHDHFKIEAIAMDSGFNNKVTFYKAFTKETGTTPSAYRRAKRS